MKTMKTMLAFVAGALVLSACSNEDILNDNVNDNDNSAKLVTLTAYQEGEAGTRAAIDASDSKKIDWTADDKINYFGGGTDEFMILSDGAGTATGTFSGTVTASGSNDYVLYPYQSTATNNAGVITAEVPMTQYAVAGSFDPKAALMVGVVNGSTVEFKNVMSYVKVTIPEGMTNCKQVSLKAKEAWTTVAGKVKINATDASWAETDAKEGQAFVRLVPSGSATTLTAGASYYIAILPQTMSTGFELIFNDNDVIKVKQSASSEVVFGRSRTKKLGAITAFTYTVGTYNLDSWYSLADRNIGATIADSEITNENKAQAYGDYIQWAGLRPSYIKLPYVASERYKKTAPYRTAGGGWPYYDKYHSNVDTKYYLDTEDDIAAMLWGGKWCIPQRSFWNTYKDNDYVKNLPHDENDGYVNGSSFDRGDVRYWSSYRSSSNEQAYLQFYNSKVTLDQGQDMRDRGFHIRPVLEKK